jgi:hypothetical protein
MEGYLKEKGIGVWNTVVAGPVPSKNQSKFATKKNNEVALKTIVNSNLVQYLLQTDIQKRTEKMQWKIQTLHRDFSPGNPNRENQHILY